MPEWKTISQRNFLKGLQATYGLFSQPAAILTRLSNLLYDRRGSLRTTDGSMVFTQRNGAIQPGDGPITDIALYSPAGVNAYYVGIQKSTVQQQGIPTGLALAQIRIGGPIANISRTPSGIVDLVITGGHNLAAVSALNGLPFNPGNLVVSGVPDASFNGIIPYDLINVQSPTLISYPQPGPSSSSAGGNLGTQLAPGTYTYAITACDGSGGETPAGPPAAITLAAPNNVVLVNWAPGQFDSNYSVYGLAGRGRLNPGPGATQTINGTSYADIGLVSTANLLPPNINTTATCQVWRMDIPSFTVSLATLPSYVLPTIGGIGGASGGGQPGSSGQGTTAAGGVPGALSPLPQMAQFTGRLIFALGNGFPPQAYSDPSIDNTGFQFIANTFTSQFPDWQPNVAWNQGDQIRDSISGGIFTATQGGVSLATRPAFVNTINAVTADGTIAWTCVAASFHGTALRGAAHAIVYAGSLWLANTWPTTTSDQLDGPNCIKMSDVNNVFSWNPLNVAFIAKDDGDQLMGLATFTIAESGISPTGSLVVFKNFSTYQITGVFGASDFSIQQAQTDMGCIAPRSIQFSPGFGIMRMTHLGFAYFNGVSDKLVSEEIRPYLFGGGPADIQPIDWNYIYFAKSAQSANPPMYVAAVPVLAPTFPGVTILPGTPPGPNLQVTMYARVSQVDVDTGAELAITPEFVVVSGDQSVIVTTPMGITSHLNYRLYLGLASGGENRFFQSVGMNAQRLAYQDLQVGSPTIGNGALNRLICYDLVQKAWAIVDLPFGISTLKQVRAPGTIPLTVAGGFADGQVRRLFAGDLLWDTGDEVQWSFRTGEVFQAGGSGKVFYRRLILRGQETLNASIAVSIMLGGRTPPAVTAQQNNLGTNQWLFEIDIMQDALNANALVSGAGMISIDSLDWQVKPKAVGAPVSVQK